MNHFSKVTAKEKLAILNKEIDTLERERDDLLYEYRLMQDKVRRMKRRTIPRLLVIGVYLIINRIIRIRQVIEMHKHIGEERLVMITRDERLHALITNQKFLLFLFIVLGIYSIVLGLRLYSMCAKTEQSLKFAGIINVKNYGTELVSTEAKIKKM